MDSAESLPTRPERRTKLRRRVDIQHIGVMATILAITVTAGIAWGVATSAVEHKVDRDEFTRYVAGAERRYQADSIERAYQASAWRRIEVKLDSTNERLSRLICEKGPSYCR